MSLNARAIALQGIGFAALLVAVQGFGMASSSAPLPVAPSAVINHGGRRAWRTAREDSHRRALRREEEELFLTLH